MPESEPDPAALASATADTELHQPKTDGGLGRDTALHGATAARPNSGPRTMRVELVVVTGPAADALIKEQAVAVRDALQWFADHPPTQSD